jgi:N-acetylglucosaminyldiphosphoundecaprenol N-acetyl-beta-D-mannosaminyltransferase
MIMRIPVANVAFDDLTMPEAVGQIVQMAQKTDRPRFVCTGNLDHLVLLSRDAEFRQVYGVADLVLADGAPIIWLSRLNKDGRALRERVAGSDLFWEMARASASTGIRLFLLGGAPGAADAAADAVHLRYPSAQICGTYCPPIARFDDPEEQEHIRSIVRAAQPDILLVAFGAPKQEKWIAGHKDEIGVPVSIGVGGTFEMASGLVKRAPLWAQRCGLEWAFRCAQEPMRLFRRYFLQDLPFLLKLTARAMMTRH